MPTVKTTAGAELNRYNGDGIRIYLQEIGRVPLLTHEQEISFGKDIQAMMNCLAIKTSLQEDLGREPSREEWAKKAEVTELKLDRIVRVGVRAKHRMIEANLRLVVAIAKKYQKRNLEFLDLIQEGSLGLERGVEKFDPTRGYKFSTYAYWWIRQAITRAIAQQSRSIRLPIHITEKLNKIKKTQRELSQEYGRNPTTAEIANALDIDLAQIREYLNVARSPVSLDVRVGDNQDTELSELLEDREFSPEVGLAQHTLAHELKSVLKELTPQQQDVLRLRFGLDGGKELSLAKVGEILSLSRERVRQLEHQALSQLRRRHSAFRDYLVS
jgi:RNA polymerase nonessential primary-like sigma factor